MKMFRKVIPICIILIIAILFAYWVYTFYRPVELVMPAYDEIEIGNRAAGRQDVVVSDAEDVEKIRELIEATTFTKSLKKYTKAPPMPYHAEVAFKNEGETVMHMWLVVSNWYRVGDYIVLTPPDRVRLIGRESEELQALLLSYMN